MRKRTNDLPTVYLAGPIGQLAYEDAVSWREEATRKLAKVGIIGVSPMRGKSYLAAEGIIGTFASQEFALSTPKGIVTRDRRDCQNSDVVLMNLLPADGKISIGSMIEVGWADSARVPLIVVMEESNVHRHTMVCEIAGYIVDDLDSGIALAKAILTYDGDECRVGPTVQ